MQENTAIVKGPALQLPETKTELVKEDIGRLVWRVEYPGILYQYKLIRISESGKGVFKIDLIYGVGQDERVRTPPRDFTCTTELGIATLRKPEFHTDFEKADLRSQERFDKEVNPDGEYRVGRYFDDVWEAWETDRLPKKKAREVLSTLNKRKHYYVSYRLADVTTR